MKSTMWKHNQRLIMSRCIAFRSNRGLMFHYSRSSSIFLSVYSLMSGWGIILESHKKAKVFVIAPGSKHTVGRCWETILHPSCQNTSALSLPRPWSWTSLRQPLPTQQAVWWLSVLGTAIVGWMLWLCLTTGTFHKACGIGAFDLKAHYMMARYKMLTMLDGSKLAASGLLPIDYLFQRPKPIHG